MDNNFIVSRSVKKISGKAVFHIEDQLAVEEPLEIQLQYGPLLNRIQKSISVTMRTPGNDEELALGFLYTENIISKKQDVLSVSQAAYNINSIIISLHERVVLNFHQTERNFLSNSSCGVCGKTSIDAIKTLGINKSDVDGMKVDAELFYALHEKLRIQQSVFQSTGGLHASALFDQEGNFIMLREDVGRHNALDKVIGTCLLKEKLPLGDVILLLSGRASFELIQKAARAGIKIVLAVGAPSSLAVQLAEECGITLIGFLRDQRFNIYSGEERVRL